METILRREDAAAWSALLAKAGVTDVFFTPGYVAANEPAFGGVAECFAYEERDAVVVYPYVRRPIEESGYWDITSVYGFGGYVKSPRDAPIPRFAAVFAEYCREAGIVSEFVRFHPLLGNHRDIEPPPVDVRLHQQVVCIDFRADGGDLHPLGDKDVRRRVRRAREAGLEVIDDLGGRFFGEFVAQYRATMALRGAERFYFFPDPFFRSIRELLGRGARLLVAVLDGRVLGGLLMLYGEEFAYYHLACSDPQSRTLGTNDLLLVAAIEWAHRIGKRRFLLGGGLNGEDSLFRYKARFSPGRADYFLGRRIHLPEIYERLCAEKMRRDGSDPEKFRSRPWFPLYRSAAADEVGDRSVPMGSPP
ncbi:GNAT family N-acetyltransferase [Anaeromyxobacter terrae]|uniref:GNAT family N-acetyltransferase n=1 Tax=Anaeromyxobacter terrae TaxID=2925406 RepID=UPI001F595FB3|nr:GNAT family N-acetyltransferase [Anaeromyxobacter sp. SG22]